MLDQNLKLIISGMISVERSRQSAKAREAAVTVRDDWTRKRALGHGRFPIEIERVCAAELEYRARSGWPFLAGPLPTPRLAGLRQMPRYSESYLRRNYELTGTASLIFTATRYVRMTAHVALVPS